MARQTQHQIKREFRAEIADLKMAVRLMCADCLGYFVDPYEPCTDQLCPLRKFYPTKNLAKHGKNLRKEMVKLAKARDNHPSFVSEIGKDEAEE